MARLFPILRSYDPKDHIPGAPRGVPWEVVAPHERQADRNHQQTLDELARRGGLSWCELAAVLEDRPWRKMKQQDAYEAVMKIINAAKPPPPKPPGM